MIRYVLASVLAASQAAAGCAEDSVTVQGDWGKVRFAVEVADEPQERARGLMFVKEMPAMSGMLFIYDSPQHATFWMRNTLIPLDMIFVDDRGEVTNVHQNAVPLDETIIDGGQGVSAVLEINGGMAARMGIDVGDVLQHPSFGDDALLPCD